MMYPNEYLRDLNAPDAPIDYEWPMWKEEGDILVLPDGYRWRIERTVRVPDLIKPGDIIRTSWSGKSGVIKVNRHISCACPVIGYFDKLCDGNYRIDAERKYHREVISWGLIIVGMNVKPNKDGTFRETEYGWINDFVAVGDRILHLFENNKDEVFIIEQGKRHKKLAPFQPELL